MRDTEKKSGCGGLAVILIVVLAVMIARHLSSPTNKPITAPPPQVSTPTSPHYLSLADLTASDYPSTVKLLEAHEIPFKKGAPIVLKNDARLYFLKDYLKSGRTGDQMEVLDYNPLSRRVYCRLKDSKGNVIAVNLLDSDAKSIQSAILAPGTDVILESIIKDTLLVNYNGDRFIVPVNDTDLLKRATAQRAANRKIEQAGLDHQKAEEAAREAKAQEQKRLRQQIQSEAGNQPEINTDGSVQAIRDYFDTTGSDFYVHYISWDKPRLDNSGGKYRWLVRVQFSGKNPMKTYSAHDWTFVIQQNKVVNTISNDTAVQ